MARRLMLLPTPASGVTCGAPPASAHLSRAAAARSTASRAPAPSPSVPKTPRSGLPYPGTEPLSRSAAALSMPVQAGSDHQPPTGARLQRTHVSSLLDTVVCVQIRKFGDRSFGLEEHHRSLGPKKSHTPGDQQQSWRTKRKKTTSPRRVSATRPRPAHDTPPPAPKRGPQHPPPGVQLWVPGMQL